MRRVVSALLMVVSLTAAAAADPGRGHTFGDEGERITDFGDVGLPDVLAEATMTDTLAAAYAQPATDPTEGGSRTCSLAARNDRSSSGPPADASQWVNVYLVPSGVNPMNYDRPAICSDGAKMESNIGYSNHNIRSWMSRERPANTAIHGKAFKQKTRTVSGYGRTFTFTDVMFLRLQNGAGYYDYNLLNRELVARGWDLTYTKFVFYYEGQARYDAARGFSALGEAPYGGRRAFVYRRYQVRDAAGTVHTKAVRWGCADGGDVPPLHEAMHLWTTVNPAAPDYDTNAAHTPYHASQQNDAMHYESKSALSGVQANGDPATAGTTRFDPGADTYTGRVLQFPAYLTTGPASGLHRC